MFFQDHFKKGKQENCNVLICFKNAIYNAENLYLFTSPLFNFHISKLALQLPAWSWCVASLVQHHRIEKVETSKNIFFAILVLWPSFLGPNGPLHLPQTKVILLERVQLTRHKWDWFIQLSTLFMVFQLFVSDTSFRRIFFIFTSNLVLNRAEPGSTCCTAIPETALFYCYHNNLLRSVF